MSKLITCLDIGSYEDALTRGKKYTALSQDDDKNKIKIEGDNGRIRWYPLSLFDLTGKDVPVLINWKFDNEPSSDTDDWVEVRFELSDETKRWCSFTTPEYIKDKITQIASENWIWSTHLIVVDRITSGNIDKILRSLDQHGNLILASLPLISSV